MLATIKLKWKSFAVGILTVAIVFYGWQTLFPGANNSALIYQQTTVTRTTISEVISVAGTAELVDEQKLRFNQSGKVTAVYFSNGESIKADTVIAELDKEDLENEIQQAEISLANSQITLQNLLDGSTEAEINKARNNVTETEQKLTIAKQNLEIAKIDYETTLTDLDNELELAVEDLTEKQSNLDTAEQNLENTLIYEDQDMSTTTADYYQKFTDALADAKSYLTNINNDLTSVNKIIGVDGEYKDLNDTIEKYLAVTDTSTLSATKTKYKSTKNSYEIILAQYEDTSSTDTTAVTDLLINLEDLMSQNTEMLDAYSAMLDASISGTDLSQTELESYRTSASTLKSNSQSRTASIQSLVNTLENLEKVDIAELRSTETITSKQEAVDSAELSLKKSQNTLDNLKQTIDSKKESARLSLVSAENEVTTLTNSLAEAQDDLADLLDGEDEDTIAKARNDVLQKELSLEKTKSSSDKYEIIAPFDGIVRQIDYKVGDNILSDDDKYVYIENPDLLKIEILLDQIDVISVEVGQTAEIVFDALPDTTFSGVIEEVNQTPESSSGVVSYPVSLTLNKDDAKIFSGMTATVDIVIAESESALTIPDSYITTTDGVSTVLKMQDGQPVLTEVTLGVSDNINTEILTGLAEGDIILSESQTLTTTNSQSTGGFGGGGMGMMGGGGPPGM